MTVATLETPAPTTAGQLAAEIQNVKLDMKLAFVTEELARLRFAILLTARWEGEQEEDLERRKELRAELADLRRDYYDKVDEIAMAFSVAQAMKTKAEVERTVVLPREVRPAEPARVDDGLHF